MDETPLLIETLGWDGTRLVRRDLHMARLAHSAAQLGYVHDAAAVAAALERISGPDPLRVRLTMDQQGVLDLTTVPLGPTDAQWHIALAPERLDARDPWLRHKTTRRALYDRTRATLRPGIDEVIFANRAGQVCEGTITNLFFADCFTDADATAPGTLPPLFTPPVADGCLPGCLRAEMLATGACSERSLSLADLGRVTLYCGNSLRGLIPARLAGAPHHELPHDPHDG